MPACIVPLETFIGTFWQHATALRIQGPLVENESTQRLFLLFRVHLQPRLPAQFDTLLPIDVVEVVLVPCSPRQGAVGVLPMPRHV